MDNPLVSVIMPVYNGAATIERALSSAFSQNLDKPFEIVVVDDGSVDETPSILARYKGRIRTLRLCRRGPAAARNAGAAVSRGLYLAFLDADDAWLPGFLQKAVDALTGSPSSVLAFSDVFPIDNYGHEVTDFVNPGKFVGTPTLDDLLKRWWPILPSAVVMRRDIFERCGGFCEEFRKPGFEDPWLWISAREHGDFQRLTQPLVLYRTVRQPERINKYVDGFRIFSQLAKGRYGKPGLALVNHFKLSYVSELGYKGLLAMSEGDMRGARHEFIRALKYDPLSVRTMLRFARTFLPVKLASALGGRTAQEGSRHVVVGLKKHTIRE